MEWISPNDRLPKQETPVLVIVSGHINILELRWEDPGYEDTYNRFQYWDDPNNDGQDFEWDSVTDWQPLPEPPKPLQGDK